MITLDDLKSNIALVKNKIDLAMTRAGRKDSVMIVGASKTMPKNVIEIVDDNKLLRVLGENRVQELVEKCDVNKNIEWHMIGVLQTNKVKHVVGNVSLIESLDRFALAEAINKQSIKREIVTDCLVQVNMGRESAKSGFFPEDIDYAIQKIKNDCTSIHVKGIMAVMPIAEENEIISLYKKLKGIYEITKDKYGLDTLSAGMTNDYHLAIEYAHSNMVRIGRAIFGERCYSHEEVGSKT